MDDIVEFDISRSTRRDEMRSKLTDQEIAERDEIGDQVQAELVGIFRVINDLIYHAPEFDYAGRAIVRSLCNRGADLAGNCFWAVDPDCVGLDSLQERFKDRLGVDPA